MRRNDQGERPVGMAKKWASSSSRRPTEAEAVAGKGNEERDTDGKRAAPWEDKDGWDAVEREREEIKKLKLKHSAGNKRVMCKLRSQDASRKRNVQREANETEDKEIYDVVTNKEKKHVVEEDANGSGNIERTPRGHRDVSRPGRKTVKKLSLGEPKGNEENAYSGSEGLSDAEKADIEKSGDGEVINWNVKPKEDAFHFGTARGLADGHGDTIFFDFDRHKSSLPVRKGEVWAMYDEHGMPRRYAKILKNGFCNSTNVRFLRFYSIDKRQWYTESGALRACGIFVPCSLASSWASLCDQTAFSHKLPGWGEEDTWTYEIYPRKGEIWAITAGVNGTPFHAGSPTIQKYHIVEILEDYNVQTGTKVVCLGKINGSYRSLFQRRTDVEENSCLWIPPMDMERFSHQVPFFRITKGGTLCGCIELDPASLPLHIEGVTGCFDHEIDETYLTLGLLDLKLSWQRVEFRDEAVWAVYDDLTLMPQKYVVIQYLYKPNPESRIKITLLRPHDIADDGRKLSDVGFPMTCGNFVVEETFDAKCGDLIVDETFDANSLPIFSHPVLFELEPMPFKYGSYVYKIFPRKGDIWGIYRNLDVGESCNLSGLLEKLQYEIVEIVSEHTSGKGTEVRKLLRMEGFKCLFRRERSTFIIPKNELYRFSHQIPAYKFEAEKADGNLKGSFILDPLLVPEMERDHFTFRDSSLLETLKLKPLRVVLQYLMGKGKSTVENRKVKRQISGHFGLELKHLKQSLDSDRKEEMEGAVAEMWDSSEQLQCGKQERKKKVEETKQVKPKKVQQQEQPLNSRSSAYAEEELRSRSSNLKHLKQSLGSNCKGGLEEGVAETRDKFKQLQCRKLKKTTKKIEELSLRHPSGSPITATPNPSLTKQVKPKKVQQKEQQLNLSSAHAEEEPRSNGSNAHHGPKGKHRRSSKQKCLLERVNASDVDELQVRSKAERLQSKLEPVLPSFVKPMKQSHVAGGFWLGLPSNFCKLHLPEDCTVVLIDEDGKEFGTVYLATKTGLSGGWRGFSIAHQLVPGDALVFQLVHHATFKELVRQSALNSHSTGLSILSAAFSLYYMEREAFQPD